MTCEEAIQIIQKHREEIRSKGVSSIAIFGSVARGEASKDSDIDILVELDPKANLGLLEFSGLQLYLNEILGTKVDLVSKNGLRMELQDTILKEAVYAG